MAYSHIQSSGLPQIMPCMTLVNNVYSIYMQYLWLAEFGGSLQYIEAALGKAIKGQLDKMDSGIIYTDSYVSR